MGKDLKDFAKIAGGVYVGNWLAGRSDRKMEERMADAEAGIRDPGRLVFIGIFLVLAFIIAWITGIADWFQGGTLIEDWFNPYSARFGGN